MQLDLAAAYPTEDLTRWTRTVTLDRATSRVLVADDWDVAPGPGGSVVHWMLAGGRGGTPHRDSSRSTRSMARARPA